IDIRNGNRKWHTQFNTNELSTPVVAEKTVFVSAPGQGVFALDENSGKERWHIPGPARYLTTVKGEVYIALGQDFDDELGPLREIASVNRITGRKIASMPVGSASFAAASANPLSIVLCDTRGHVQCLRSTKEPYLRPEQLTAVLAADQESAIGSMKKSASSQPAARPSALPTGMEDPFRSKSSVPPAAGSGAAGATAKPPAKAV